MPNYKRIHQWSLMNKGERERLIEVLVAALEKDAGRRLDREWTAGFARSLLICFDAMIDADVRDRPDPRELR